MGGLQSLEIPPQKRILDDLVLKNTNCKLPVRLRKNCLINNNFTLHLTLLLSGSEYVVVASDLDLTCCVQGLDLGGTDGVMEH